MKRFFGRKEKDSIIIDGGELVHLRSVLRAQEGEKIIVSLNDDNDYFCRLDKIGKDKAIAKIESVSPCKALPKKQIDLFQSLPKKEYFEEIITKATELGISNIIPFINKFSVVHSFKTQRNEQILVTACKQCARSRIPNLEDVIDFEKMLDRLKNYDMIVFANEHETSPFKLGDLKSKDKIAIIVGCEAGFSEDEVQKIIACGAKSISLGARILRCPTAVTATVAIVNVLSGN